MDDTQDAHPHARDSSDADPARPRRPWIAPALIRHASLTALTLQYPATLVVDPQTGELLDPNNPEHWARLAAVPGSTGFFP